MIKIEKNRETVELSTLDGLRGFAEISESIEISVYDLNKVILLSQAEVETYMYNHNIKLQEVYSYNLFDDEAEQSCIIGYELI